MKLTKLGLTAIVAMMMSSGLASAGDRHVEELLAITDLKADGQSSLSLKDGISLALKEQEGLLEFAKIEYEDQEITYQIEISDGSDVHWVEIDPKTGALKARRLDMGETLVNYATFGLLNISADQHPAITSNFQKGIRDIEGQILGVEIEREDGRIFYEVRSLKDDRVSLTLISGLTGETVFYSHMSYGDDEGDDHQDRHH